MRRMVGFAVLSFVISACSPGTGPEGQEADGAVASAVEPTGTVIEIAMVGVGDTYFEPADVTAKRGDVLRFVLESGVHNVEFPADQNPSGVELPETSPMLQAPGQTWDYTVDLPVGTYTYHCTPHAALGMIGSLTVTE